MLLSVPILFTGPHKDAGYRALAFSFWHLHGVNGWKSNSYYLSTTRSPEMLCSRYSKTCLKRPLKKKTKNGFQDQLLLNAGQMYCRMLQGEHSAILSTFIKLPFVIKIFFSLFLSCHLRQVLLYCVLCKMNILR